MTERLLQFIWQFQYFNRKELELQTGEQLTILHPGQYNRNQGPDFLQAGIRINQTTWAGNIELHIKTSHWNKHAHQSDPNYDSVILHVVWEDDLPHSDNHMPLLVLQDRVPKLLLHQYETWMNGRSFIACENQAALVNHMVWTSWKERLLVERLQRKTAVVMTYLQQNNHHWEETCWWLLARSFGSKVNAEAFEAIARSVPVNIQAKHKQQLQQLEALLLGQAGLLEREFAEEYPSVLKNEYRFYKTKYHLAPIHHTVHFLRMRPFNFPTIRLAQLAMLVHTTDHLFATIRETSNIQTIRELLNITASEYWHHHYTLHEPSACKPKKLGEQMTSSIIINTIVPLLFAYGQLHGEPVYRDRALHWLEALEPEKNTITAGFERLHIPCQHAFDSQALIELKSSYCDHRRCLDCAVGTALIRHSLSS